ncbi:MAG: hypothetical protein L6277_12090, partial [Desulfobacterales bacterium]|nr:hypothetical protein [Desulfobacterales bacterium]
PRFFTPLRSVQNDMNIQCLLTATSYKSPAAGWTGPSPALFTGVKGSPTTGFQLPILKSP